MVHGPQWLLSTCFKRDWRVTDQTKVSGFQVSSLCTSCAPDPVLGTGDTKSDSDMAHKSDSDTAYFLKELSL